MQVMHVALLQASLNSCLVHLYWQYVVLYDASTRTEQECCSDIPTDMMKTIVQGHRNCKTCDALLA